MGDSYLSHKKFERAVEEIALQIKAKGKKYKYVYGIPRGGLILAVRLSHYMGMELIDSTSEKHFAGEKDKVLIVDDISDSGNTLKPYNDSGFDIATIYYKEGTSTVKPTYYARTNKERITFWWELKQGEKHL